MTEFTTSLPYTTLEGANPRARKVLEQAQAQVGFIPNMYAAMVNSPGALETYLKGYALFREESGFSPAEQEVVFLIISRENNCHYCMAAHSMLADKKSGVPEDVLRAIREARDPADARMGALTRFVQAMVRSRGMPPRADVSAFLVAGFSERQILEVILAIAVKTLSNYTNHLFSTPVDGMFNTYAWRPSASAVA